LGAKLRWLVGILLVCAAAPALAGDLLFPSVKAVVYPGDILSEDMLADQPLTDSAARGAIALSHDQLVGKMAKRTLLPGKPIPLAAIDNPRVIRNGAEVTMVYIDGALTITTVGAAMQDGAIGDLIKVRNQDSGVTVQGRIRADGSVLVSGG
jgi:flagellar basal body P-ring formation protein FlgA